MSEEYGDRQIQDLNNLMNLVDVLVVFVGNDGKVRMINRKGCELLGCPETWIVGKDWFRSFLPESARDYVQTRFENLISGEKEPDSYFESSILTRMGEERVILWHNTVIKDERGEAVGVLSSGEDITERNRAEEALRESEERFRGLVEATSDMVWEVDEELRYTYVSPRISDVLGYEPQEVLGKTPFDFMLPVEAERVGELIRPAVQAQEPFNLLENVNQHRQGRIVILESSGVPVFDAGGYFRGYRGINRDITARKRTEQALAASEGRFRNIVESSPTGMHMYRLESDERLVFMVANPAADNILGVDHTQFIGKTIEEAFPPLAATEVPERYRLAAGKGIPWHTEQITYKDDKIEGAFEVYAFQTSPGRMAAMFTEITARKRTEEALRESEERFRLLAENIPGVIYLCRKDERYTMIYLNDEVEALTGYPKENFLADKISIVDLYHPDDNAWIPSEVDAALAEKRPFNITYRIKHRSGEWRWIKEVGVGVFRNDQLHFLEGYLNDITESKLASESIKKRTEDVALINELNTAINQGVSLEEIVSLLTKRTKEIFSGFGAGLYLVSEDKKSLELVNLVLPRMVVNAVEKLTGTKIDKVRIPLVKGSFFYDAMRTKKTQLIDDPEAVQRFVGDYFPPGVVKRYMPGIVKALRLGSIINLPLILEDEVIGFMNISRKQLFSEDDLRRIAALGNQLTSLLKHKIAEEKEREYFSELNSLSQTAMDFVGFEPGDDIYGYIAEKLRELADNTIVGVASYDESKDIFTVKAMAGLGDAAGRFMKILGQDAVGMSSRVTPEVNSKLLQRRLHEFPVDLHTLTRGKISTGINDAVQAVLGVTSIYAMGVVRHNTLLGAVILAPGKGIELRNRKILEAFINQAAVALQRKRAEEETRESEEHFRSIFDNALTGMYRTTPDGRILEANPALVRMLGYDSFKELAKQNLEDKEKHHFTPENARATFKELIERDGEVVGLESIWLGRDSSPLHVRESARIIKNEQGEILYYEGTVEDITHRKKAELELVRSEARYRMLFESANDALYVFELDKDSNPGIFQEVNDVAARMLGYTKNELLQMTPRDITAPEKRELEKDVLRGLLDEKHVVFEQLQVAKDGRKIPVEISAHLFDYAGRTVILASVRDITERKRTEEALRSRADFENLIATVSTSFVALPIEEIDDGINEALQEIGKFAGVDRSYLFLFHDNATLMSNTHEWCRDPSLFERQNLKDLPIDSFPWFTEKILRGEIVYCSRVADLGEEARVEKLEWERERIKSLINVPLILEGKVVGFVGFDSVYQEKQWPEDIIALLTIVGETFANALERKHAEDAKSESEEKYRSLVERSLSGIYITQSHIIKFCNQRFAEMFGYRNADEILGKNVRELVSAESWNLVDEQVRLRESGQKEVARYEFKGVKKDGSPIDVEVLGGRITYQGKPAIQGTMMDITERKRSEERLLERTEELTILNERFEFILQATKTNVDIIDSDFNVLYVDPQWLKLYGNPEGKQCFDYFMGQRTPCPTCGIPKAIETGKTVVTEEMLPREDNRIIEVHTIPYQDADGRWLVAEFNIDITERKKVEETLRESEEKFRSLAEESPNMIFIYGKGRVLYANKKSEEMMGYTREEFYSPDFNFITLIAPESKEFIVHNLTRHMKGEEIQPYEYSLVAKQGKTIDAILTSKLIQYDGASAILGIVTDITERKRAEEALRESEKRYKGLFEDSPISLWEEDLSGVKAYIDDLKAGGVENFRKYFERHPEEAVHWSELEKIIEVNRATLSLYRAGNKEELIEGLDLILCKESYATLREQLIAIAEGKTAFQSESVNMTLKGEKKHVSLKLTVAPGYEESLSKVLISIVDITERKRSEEALRQSEEFNRAVVENLPLGVSVRTRTGRLVSVNESWRKIWAAPDEEIAKDMTRERTLLKFDESDLYMKEWWDDVRKVYEEGGRLFIPEVQIPSPRTGGAKWVSQFFYALEGPQHEVESVVILTQDITERKRAEEAVRESEERYRTLVETSPDAISMINLEGRIIYASQRKVELYGYQSQDEMAGMDFLDLVVPEEREKAAGMFDEILTKGTLKNVEFALQRKDGKRFIGEFNLSLLRDATGNPFAFITTSRDITERKRMQEQLIRTSKLASLGVLASGVAHQINNPLATMLFASTALKDLFKDENLAPEIREKSGRFFETLEEQVDRTRRVVSGLLSFAQTKRSEIASTDVNMTIRKALDFICEHLSLTNIELTLDLQDDIPFASADPVALVEVLVNIVQNSYEAISGKGKLCLRTGPGEDDSIRITVSDNGPGVPPELQDEIFEPLFTTKDAEKGTGLGLSVSVLLLERFGGRIWVEDTPGGGATFVVEVPQVKEEANEFG